MTMGVHDGPRNPFYEVNHMETHLGLIIRPFNLPEVVRVPADACDAVPALHELLDCEFFGIIPVRIGDEVYDLYHDDGFLLHDRAPVVTFVTENGTPIIGPCLLLRRGEDGGSAPLTADDLDMIQGFVFDMMTEDPDIRGWIHRTWYIDAGSGRA